MLGLKLIHVSLKGPRRQRVNHWRSCPVCYSVLTWHGAIPTASVVAWSWSSELVVMFVDVVDCSDFRAAMLGRWSLYMSRHLLLDRGPGSRSTVHASGWRHAMDAFYELPKYLPYIRRTKSPIFNDSHLVLKSSLPNPLKPGVKSRMKM